MPAAFSPAPPPPPPSPINLAQQRKSSRTVFEMAPPTPQSFGEAEKTHLKERLERTRKLKIAVKPGFPARVIKEQEAESTNSSSSGMNQKQGEIEGDKQSESKRSPDSPWLTDSEPPTRRSNPSLGASTTTCERENRGIRIEGFDIPASQPQPVPAACRPSLSRSTNASTSSLSLLFARTPFLAPAAPVEPACCPDVGTSASSGLAGQTWNGDIVGRTLAKSRAPTPSTPPDIARQATAPHVLSSSASLPSLTRATSCKRSRFLTTSTSLTTTPSTSPPKPSCTLQFTRRSTPARQHSFRDTWSAVQAGVKANDMVTRKKGVMAERPDSEIEQEEIDHSECEDLDFNCFQPSIFASHYSNSATSLSSSSSVLPAGGSSISSSPKSTSGSRLAPSNSTSDFFESRQSDKRRGSLGSRVADLRQLRRQQAVRKNELGEELKSECNAEESPKSRRSSSSTASATSLPFLQFNVNKLFSLS